MNDRVNGCENRKPGGWQDPQIWKRVPLETPTKSINGTTGTGVAPGSPVSLGSPGPVMVLDS